MIDDVLEISEYDHEENFIKSYNFKSYSTLSVNHDLPFDLTLDPENNLFIEKELVLVPVKNQVNNFRSKLDVKSLGLESDQLALTLINQR